MKIRSRGMQNFIIGWLPSTARLIEYRLAEASDYHGLSLAKSPPSKPPLLATHDALQ